MTYPASASPGVYPPASSPRTAARCSRSRARQGGGQRRRTMPQPVAVRGQFDSGAPKGHQQRGEFVGVRVHSSPQPSPGPLCAPASPFCANPSGLAFVGESGALWGIDHTHRPLAAFHQESDPRDRPELPFETSIERPGADRSRLERSMSGFHRPVACLLVLVQALMAAGLGPRALCRDPDGSTCVDSALSPCCCHRHQESPCCGEDGCDEASPADAGRTHLASACQCVCTPVLGQLLGVQRTATKATLDVATGSDAIAVDTAFPTVAWVPAARNWRLPLRTGPPGRSGLAHLGTVILRL